MLQAATILVANWLVEKIFGDQNSGKSWVMAANFTVKGGQKATFWKSELGVLPSVLIDKKSPKHTQFSQIWSNMKISNNPVKYEVLIKQYLRSILDISEWSKSL